ncbi:protein of unknown function [Candidatus Hydrogenisulfobacillus filiaventi]|uniref:Uncharacterized protein n=1 Tax=Candidatus Hydrogenisulfobacillus filiaventi TaxID=2707344 RepID=A0A6F8ZHE3_9FIRM|nr:protein of unknown function [Candidatus Hydrogenisulfobacillus filiaventi]
MDPIRFPSNGLKLALATTDVLLSSTVID